MGCVRSSEKVGDAPRVEDRNSEAAAAAAAAAAGRGKAADEASSRPSADVAPGQPRPLSNLEKVKSICHGKKPEHVHQPGEGKGPPPPAAKRTP